jgi:hypothetical protein
MQTTSYAVFHFLLHVGYIMFCGQLLVSEKDTDAEFVFDSASDTLAGIGIESASRI